MHMLIKSPNLEAKIPTQKLVVASTKSGVDVVLSSPKAVASYILLTPSNWPVFNSVPVCFTNTLAAISTKRKAQSRFLQSTSVPLGYLLNYISITVVYEALENTININDDN